MSDDNLLKATIRLAHAKPKLRPHLLPIIVEAKKWISDAIKHPGRVHKYLGIPEDETIPIGKINAAIAELEKKEKKTKEDTSILRALNLAKTLKK